MRPPWISGFSSGRNSHGKGTYEVKPIYALLLLSFLIAHPAVAIWKPHLPHKKSATPETTTPAPERTSQAPEKPASAAEIDADTRTVGPVAFAFVAGSHHNMGTVLSYNLAAGYNFTPKIGVDAGFNIITTRTPFSIITTADWRTTTILGSPFVDLRYYSDHHGINLETVVTGQGGLSSIRTYSNGRFVAELYNHAYKSYLVSPDTLSVTPFLNFGFGNGTVDRTVLATPYDVARPYETLGGIGSGELGLTFTIFKNYKLNASAYGLAPVGPQHVFSKLVAPDSLISDPNALNHNRYWDANFLTIGPSRIAHDGGGTVLVGHYPLPSCDLGVRLHAQHSLRLWRGVLHA